MQVLRTTLMLTLLSLWWLTTPAEAQGPTTRYGIGADLTAFPQDTPQKTLGSVLKAVETKKWDYLVAQLADPEFVDERIKRVFGGKFADQVEDTQARLDPFVLKQMRRFLDKGAWTIKGSAAVVRLPAPERKVVRFRQKDGRWFLEHPSQPPRS